MSKLIGSGENQVSTNDMLGRMAFQDPEALVVKPQVVAEPQRAGDMVFQSASDTEVNLKIKGQDGKVRGFSIPVIGAGEKPVLDLAKGSGKVDLKPAFVADFTKGTVDPRVAFSRASLGAKTGRGGKMAQALVDVPRLEYDQLTGLCRGVLIEPAATNLAKFSNNFTQWNLHETPSAWSGGGAAPVLTPNFEIGPHGLPATRVKLSTKGAGGGARSGFYLDSSINAMGITPSTWAIIKPLSGTPVADVAKLFVFSAGPQGVQREPVDLGGGWYRTHTALIAPTTSPAGTVRIQQVGGDKALDFVLELVQCELGSTPTSYIPTSGIEATRAADNLTIPLDDSWFNRQEGTLYFDFGDASGSASGPPHFIAFGLTAGAGMADGTLGVYFTSAGSPVLRHKIPGPSESVVLPFGSGSLENRRLAMTFSKAGVACHSTNQTAAKISNDAQLILNAVDKIYITPLLRGIIKEIRYYDKALTDAQLQTLTA